MWHRRWPKWFKPGESYTCECDFTFTRYKKLCCVSYFAFSYTSTLQNWKELEEKFGDCAGYLEKRSGVPNTVSWRHRK